jgi:mannose/fructose/N-acetylgalactosamine-specific phosphotransferase system component IIC
VIVIGAMLLVIAAVCFILGFALQAASVLLWVGVGLVVVGAAVLVYERLSHKRLP